MKTAAKTGRARPLNPINQIDATRDQIIDLLAQGLAAHERRIEAPRLQQFADEFMLWRKQQDRLVVKDVPLLCRFLQGRIVQISAALEQGRVLHGEYTRRLGQVPAGSEHNALLMQYAEKLGADAATLRGDRRALKRWFGMDALGDRFARGQANSERLLTLALRQLGHLGAAFLRQTAAADSQHWRQLALEATVLPLFAHIGNVQVRIDAFGCLATALASLPRAQQEGALGAQALQYVYRSAQDAGLNVWVQCAALKLLQSLSPANFATVARKRLQQVHAGDDLFVRRRIVDVLVARIDDEQELAALLRLGAHDPSPHVRQGVAAALATLPAGADLILAELLPQLLLHDAEPRVRAAASLQLPLLMNHASLPLQDWLAQALASEKDLFALRVLLHTLETCVIELASRASQSRNAAQDVALWLNACNAALDALHLFAHYKVRRWAAQTAEVLWLYGEPALIDFIAPLQAALHACAPGKCVRLPQVFSALSKPQLARVLAVLTQRDYGVSLEQTALGWRLWRGHRFGFRLWRALHEWRHPSPDKRQAFRHTVGRLFRGQIRVPSGILAEMSETKVPGEPLQLDTEAGWRPYLPLADELISALDEDFNADPLRIYTAEGVTEVRAPSSLLARVRARTWLSLNFSRLAHMRNWREESQAKPDSYLQQVAKLGFEVEFKSHDYAPGWRWNLDPAVGRFFAAAPLGLLGSEAGSQDWQPRLAEHWTRFENYFYSAFDNSLFELTLFTAGALLLFTANHIWQNWLMRRARKAIPLVVGGWGTRGKSGTERIKAALFNALGYSVVSKTTGCEAMFLHGHPFQALREMFLFRPYDKATIWEQHHLVRMSPKLGCEVFLWECMALTPDFVQLLQKSWMRDDLSTITNTIPDHEDLQGPAGINIPQVMTNFIPPGGVLLTSEEQMRPILKTAAERLKTRFVGVGWLESGLLAPDVLARFPYQEHPDNIALVLAMGRELGIADDFALKEMADRVVPDLGVLKTYPLAGVAGRKLSFVNGMSANERFGCIGNWNRVGFNRIDHEAEPGVFISTVVNNRGDRIARSRVFANILVEDLRADVHFLIGSNLPGLQGYIREAWDAHARGISLWPPAGGDEAQGQAGQQGQVLPQTVLDNFARHMRLCFTPAHIEARLRAMLAGQGLAEQAGQVLPHWQDEAALRSALAGIGCSMVDETVAFVASARSAMAEHAAFKARLDAHGSEGSKGGGPNAQLDQDFRELLWQWFARKLVVVEDYYASGDSIIQMLAEHTPPGCENRVMGIQNIKGTGLGFIYCWQAWDSCHVAGQRLASRDVQQVEQGLSDLMQMQNFGLLSEQWLQQTLASARASSHLQSERHQAALTQIEANLQKAMEQVRQRMGAKAQSGWLEKVCGALEGFFDAGDAVRRRRKANRIYADLANGRISHARAAIELQDLTQRQKGGWLFKSL
jgi:poly-gamma-glutamate synthase PgsB/CapB